ncbi:MAG: hypothetical protein J6S85_22300 [Methanobrevibacter sp.]|nr:hypothetical protein [Methanobrevibacter sp.]
MAYLNEYPHVEPNKLNLDWLLEQYSTFNKRIAEILQHFDETVEQIRADFQTAVDTFENQLEAFESNIMGQFEAYRTLVNSTISTFETTVNETISNFETSINDDFNDFKDDVNTQVETISDALDVISQDVVTYVSQHISQWTLEALSIDVTVPQTLNTDTYGNVTLTGVGVSQKVVILGVSRETHAGGGAPYINHFDEKYVNGDIYPQVETAWANDVWNITIRDKCPTSGISSKTYTVFYTIM